MKKLLTKAAYAAVVVLWTIILLVASSPVTGVVAVSSLQSDPHGITKRRRHDPHDGLNEEHGDGSLLKDDRALARPPPVTSVQDEDNFGRTRNSDDVNKRKKVETDYRSRREENNKSVQQQHFSKHSVDQKIPVPTTVTMLEHPIDRQGQSLPFENKGTTTCLIDMAPVRIEIHTKTRHMHAMSWDVTDITKKITILSSSMKNEYDVSNTISVTTRCIDSTKCYRFRIYNSFEDVAGGNGWFKVYYDHRVILEGGKGGEFVGSPTSISVRFGDGCMWLPATSSATPGSSSSYSMQASKLDHPTSDSMPLLSSAESSFSRPPSEDEGLSILINLQQTSAPTKVSSLPSVQQYVSPSPSKMPSLSPVQSPISTVTGVPSTLPSKSKTYSPSGLPSTKPSGFKCGGNDVSVRIQIHTDKYPEETSWRLVYPRTENSDATISSKRGYYQNEETLYDDILCVDPAECHQFEILDSRNDGICCKYGEGWYKVFYGDVLVAQGGNFESLESSALFGDRCPSQAPSLSLAPSSLPSVFPSTSPSSLPIVFPSTNPNTSQLPSSSNTPSTLATISFAPSDFVAQSTSWRLFVPES